MTIGSSGCSSCGENPNAVELAVAVKANQIARAQGAQVLELLDAAARTLEAAPAADSGRGAQIDVVGCTSTWP